MKQRIYLAGPISLGVLTDNICQGTEAAVMLMKAGFAPFCSMLTCYMAGSVPEVTPCGLTHADWLGSDLPWVAVADAVVRLPGESRGADLETALANELGIPVYASVDALIASPPSPGDPRFHALLRELAQLHNRKSADYGHGKDFLANVRASEAWGIPAWIGTMVRACDKIIRLQSFAQKRKLECEGVEDSLLDLSAYALIALLLWREQHPPSG